MAISSISLVFIWMLQLSSAETPGQNHSLTTVTTKEMTGTPTQIQMTIQETASLSTLSEVSGQVTPSITADISPRVETTQTTSKTVLMNEIAATMATHISPQVNSSTVTMKSTTEVHLQAITTATTVATSQDSNPTTTASAPLILSSSTQSQNTGKTSTFQLTSDKVTHLSNLSTHPAQSTHLISTTTTSTQPAKKSTSTSPSPVTGDSTATEMTPFIHSTTAKNNSQEKKAVSGQKTNHGKVVAGLIGGSLVVMMIGFLIIFIKKRKLQIQQTTTTDWAGPSPFLENAAENGQMTQRSSHRISLSSFLPQRLSKRMSLLPESGEELEDLTPGITFGDKYQESTFGQEVERNDVQESNGTAAGVPEIKNTQDAPETVKNSDSVTLSQTNNPLSTNDNSQTANLSQDSANSPTVSASVGLNDDQK